MLSAPPETSKVVIFVSAKKLRGERTRVVYFRISYTEFRSAPTVQRSHLCIQNITLQNNANGQIKRLLNSTIPFFSK